MLHVTFKTSCTLKIILDYAPPEIVDGVAGSGGEWWGVEAGGILLLGCRERPSRFEGGVRWHGLVVRTECLVLSTFPAVTTSYLSSTSSLWHP